MTIQENIIRIAKEIDIDQRAWAIKFYTKWSGDALDQMITQNHSTTIKQGKKYTKIDIGSSGAFMVNKETGIVHGIKGYGVVHPKIIHGPADKINGADLIKRQYARANTKPLAI